MIPSSDSKSCMQQKTAKNATASVQHQYKLVPSTHLVWPSLHLHLQIEEVYFSFPLCFNLEVQIHLTQGGQEQCCWCFSHVKGNKTLTEVILPVASLPEAACFVTTLASIYCRWLSFLRGRPALSTDSTELCVPCYVRPYMQLLLV